MNNTINMTEVFNSIDTRKAQALATIAKYSADDRAEASRVASLYDNCAKTSIKHLCDTADILQDRFQPTTKAPTMTHTEYMAFFDKWIFYQFPREEDNWRNLDILRTVAKIVSDPDDLADWVKRDCWSMYDLAKEQTK